MDSIEPQKNIIGHMLVYKCVLHDLHACGCLNTSRACTWTMDHLIQYTIVNIVRRFSSIVNEPRSYIVVGATNKVRAV